MNCLIFLYIQEVPQRNSVLKPASSLMVKTFLLKSETREWCTSSSLLLTREIYQKTWGKTGITWDDDKIEYLLRTQKVD